MGPLRNGSSEEDATLCQIAKTGDGKKRYRGVFVLGNEILIRRTMAVSRRQAKSNLINRILQEKGLKKGKWIHKLYDGHIDNHTIEREE